jgi:hypothetical protein
VHAKAPGVIITSVTGPYQFGHGGPGGRWILPEPGIELPNEPEFSPDIAGWRRERLPALPKDEPLRTVPD